MENIVNDPESEVMEETMEDNLSMEDSSDMYKVEYWEEGEEEPTGYKIKGKFLFGKSVEMLKLRLKKSKFSKKIQDQKYFVTDVRNTKHGSEVDIEIDDKEKGGACVKIFGPNKKKEYTIVINKMRKFPQKFVKVVATEIIIPTLDNFLISIQKEGQNESSKSPMEFCCVDCGKRFVSDRNLKIHTAKAHLQDKREDIMKRKQASVVKEYNSLNPPSNKKSRNAHQSKLQTENKEIPMELDIVVGGGNSNVKEQEGENLHIDIVHIVREIVELKKVNEENQVVIKNLANKVELLECKIKTLTNQEYNCLQCSFQSNEESLLKKHIKVAHENGCDICEDKFDSRKDLVDHKKSQHSLPTVYCKDYLIDKCMFSKEECLYLHAEKQKVIVELIKCLKCDNTLKNNEELTEHMKVHQEDDEKDDDGIMHVDQFECTTCKNSFTTYEVFSEHQELHSLQKQNKCSLCDNDFESLELLHEHKKSHHQYICTKCNEEFSSMNDLQNHTRLHLRYIPCKNLPNCKYGDNCHYSHEERNENIYPCFECGEKLEGLKNLMNHRKLKHETPVCKKFLEKNVSIVSKDVG